MARVTTQQQQQHNLSAPTKPFTIHSNNGWALAFASATHAITFHDVFIRHGLPDFEIEKNGAPRGESNASSFLIKNPIFQGGFVLVCFSFFFSLLRKTELMTRIARKTRERERWKLARTRISYCSFVNRDKDVFMYIDESLKKFVEFYIIGNYELRRRKRKRKRKKIAHDYAYACLLKEKDRSNVILYNTTFDRLARMKPRDLNRSIAVVLRHFLWIYIFDQACV